MRFWKLAVSAAMVGGLLAAPVSAQQPDEKVLCEWNQPEPHLLLVTPLGAERRAGQGVPVCVSLAKCWYESSIEKRGVAVYCRGFQTPDGWACPDATYCGNSTAIDSYLPDLIVNLSVDSDEPEPAGPGP